MSVSLAPSGNYSIDPTHSQIGFIARHAMITKVRGSFTDFSGSGLFDAENPEKSHLSLNLAVDSVDTGNKDRDNHLRGGDFFDTDTFKEIAFQSTQVAQKSGDTYEVSGDLTIKGTTLPIVFSLTNTGTVVDPFGNTRFGLEGSVVVNRKDWGLTWNAAIEAGGVLVSEKVTLQFDVSAILEK